MIRGKDYLFTKERLILVISVRAPVGPVNIASEKSVIGRGLSALRVKDDNDFLYLYYFLKSNQNLINRFSTGSTFKAITQKDIKRIPIKIPESPIDQKRIAKVLSDCEALIQKRKASIALLDELVKSTFLEMFGDPASNKYDYPTQTLKEISTRFSDGPFGSNLKTEHYADEGIQVIRLQNIGINQLVEKDRKFVSQDYFQKVLTKYSCYPGDVIIATMGEPNVRSCVIPDHLEIAINKADCVLCRVNSEVATAEYISNLINQEGFLFLAKSHIHGQTRARISSGQLSRMSVPIPPMEDQAKFTKVVQRLEKIKTQFHYSLQELENLYGSLSQRAFNGELDLSGVELDEVTQKVPNIEITGNHNQITFGKENAQQINISGKDLSGFSEDEGFY